MPLYYYRTRCGERGVRGDPRRSNIEAYSPEKSVPLKGKASLGEAPLGRASLGKGLQGRASLVTCPRGEAIAQYPFERYFYPVYFDPPSPPLFVPYAAQHPMNHHRNSRRPNAIPPMSPFDHPSYPDAVGMPVRLDNDPSIPLPAAARQLYSAVTNAINFFQGFYDSYARAVAGMDADGDRELLDHLWAAHIRRNMADPTRNWNRSEPSDPSDNDKDDANNENSNDQNSNKKKKKDGGNKGKGKSKRKGDLALDRLSFTQHQKRIRERTQTFHRSSYPRLPQQAAMAIASAGDWPEADLYAKRKLHRSAEALKRKVRNSHEDLEDALEGMGTDFEMAEIAIGELKCLKQNLETYKSCWGEASSTEEGADWSS